MLYLYRILKIEIYFKFLFVGNCGPDVEAAFLKQLEDEFSKYGQLIEIVVPKKRAYVFVIYEDENSALKAVENLQAKSITIGQTIACFYLFPVNTGYIVFKYLIQLQLCQDLSHFSWWKKA